MFILSLPYKKTYSPSLPHFIKFCSCGYNVSSMQVKMFLWNLPRFYFPYVQSNSMDNSLIFSASTLKSTQSAPLHPNPAINSWFCLQRVLESVSMPLTLCSKLCLLYIFLWWLPKGFIITQATEGNRILLSQTRVKIVINRAEHLA